LSVPEIRLGQSPAGAPAELGCFRNKSIELEAMAELQSFVAIYPLNFSGFRQTLANVQHAENARVY
jgi:hypothetical protein